MQQGRSSTTEAAATVVVSGGSWPSAYTRAGVIVRLADANFSTEPESKQQSVAPTRRSPRVRILESVGLGLLLLQVTIVTAQQPDAGGILAAAHSALGGESRIAAVKTLVVTGRSRQLRGDN